MLDISNLPDVIINGPFWMARATVIRLANPSNSRAFRTLFLSNQSRRAFDEQNVFLPGTMFALCAVRRVRLEPGQNAFDLTWRRFGNDQVPRRPSLQEIEEYLQTGQLSLLLVQAGSTEWPRSAEGDLPEFTCLAGEISLARLRAEQKGDADACQILYRALNLGSPEPDPCQSPSASPWSISVHASGLSIKGLATLPWQTEPISAFFQLARLQPDDQQPGYRLTIEAERLSGAEHAAIIKAWQGLNDSLNPKNRFSAQADSSEVPTPTWVTLSIANPLRIPRLYWQIAPWQESPESLPLHFERGEFDLLLSDQQPQDQENPPTSLARVIVDQFSIEPADGEQLQVSISAGTPSEMLQGQLVYEAALNGNLWQETVSLSELDVAFDPVEAPKLLRVQQDLLPPEWIPGDDPVPLDPPLVWGFMPLADGWAQLPVPNMTEQIYLDARLAQLDDTLPTSTTALLQGAVSLGNDEVATLTEHPDEQAWQITLAGAGAVEGNWTLALNPGDGSYRLAGITLSIDAPDIICNGLFWFSTGRPTVQDALPDLADWVAGLEAMPLRTLKPERDLFPAVIVTKIRELVFSLRQTNSRATASLQNWSMVYVTETETLQALIEAGVLPADTFSRYLPLAWRRHAALPMIQALPLTQNQSPPNYPSASRQLIPFELAGDSEWLFGTRSHNGAATWPELLSAAVPAWEWQDVFDLPLAALSLPGLVLDPNLPSEENGMPPDPGLLLSPQYRFDLPYTDQVNALAQLPKTPRDPDEVSPLPDSPQPQPAQPLSRETLGDYWQRLSEQASLASLDASAAFTSQAGQTLIKYLIEPFDWPVTASLNLTTYPGSLTVNNIDLAEPAQLALEREDALRGISGRFIQTGDGTLRRLADGQSGGDGVFQVQAGSMAAQANNGSMRDQRGLVRSASRQDANLIKTPVHLLENVPTGGALTVDHLVSTRQAVELDLGEGNRWQVWFRDLPLQEDTFERSHTRSDKAQDVNDPEALSREYNFLAGYEWRLRDAASELQIEAPRLSVFNLHFYPLTLEQVSLMGNRVSRIEVIGRLQLPLQQALELPDFNNAVRIIFTDESSSELAENVLTLQAIALESSTGEWPLSAQGGEQTDAPLLEWQSVSLQADNNALVIENSLLKFHLFGTDWSVPIGPLTFPETPGVVEQRHNFNLSESSESLVPDFLSLALDLAPETLSHQANLALGVRVGNPQRRTFTALVQFPLADKLAHPLDLQTAVLFDDLSLTDATVQFSENALQFVWQTQEPANAGAERPMLLPGMPIHSNEGPGFAALTFLVTPSQADAGVRVPQLPLRTCYAEVLLFCRWGYFLQEPLPFENPTPEQKLVQAFGSSAGNLVFSFTSQWSADATGGIWEEQGLLNGFLEVKNLISWPKAMAFDAESARLTLPAARADDSAPSLDHARHTIRILLNQHDMPADILVIGEGALLFNLAQDKTWQFLAIVEHQLIDITPGEQFETVTSAQDRRWTVLQEVRLTPPESFRQFLEIGGNMVIDPNDGIGPMSGLHGYFREDIRQALTGAGGPDSLGQLPPETLLVEASAPHWVRQSPASEANNPPVTLPPTTLQFLPNGSQLGILSTPQDYAPSDPSHPAWLLLITPFLGRLQNSDHDGLVSPEPDGLTALQVDPIWRIQQRRTATPEDALPFLSLVFASWADSEPLEFTISELDWALARTWVRLDPISLEENWFRLQNPLPEPETSRLQSILSARPDTPARLSRSVALRRAFDAFKPFYPPQLPDDYELPEAIESGDIVWRQGSWLVIQGVDEPTRNSYGWHIVGLQIMTSPLWSDDPNQAATRQRLPAATLIPARLESNGQANERPLSLAVSPYLGLEFKQALDATFEPQLASVELLCLERASGQLRPVASQLREIAGDQSLQSSPDWNKVQIWARETHRRLSPASTVAILRLRQINKNTDQESQSQALLTTSYGFALVENLELPHPLTKRIAQLRSTISQLRFREGQFGGSQMPEDVQPFELAPPQTIGAQPFYLETTHPAAAGWPWGLSALRLSVQYTQSKKGVVGRLGNGRNGDAAGDTAEAVSLWWHAPQLQVQFRAALRSERPAAGLPAQFRAPAIKSLLPVLPRAPLPGIDLAGLLRPPEGETQPWQPILPGGLRYLLLGNRAGSMLAIRNQLIRQRIPAGDGPQDRMVSGSVPVQHRVPRPVSLPANQMANREHALQTWASYFEPEQNALIGHAPLDEAFFAACGGRPARRLQLKLIEPTRGAPSATWNGDLLFAIVVSEEPEPEQALDPIAAWEINLKLVDEGDTFTYSSSPEDAGSGVYRFSLAQQGATRLVERLQTKPAGSVLTAQARVKPTDTTDGFYQSLKFDIRIRDESTLPLPLEPYFIHFEDPEYNRRLVSPTASATRPVKVEIVGHETTGDYIIQTVRQPARLSADRREYNPDSRLAIRYDWEDGRITSTAQLTIERIGQDGVPVTLTLDADLMVDLGEIEPGQLKQLSLLDLKEGSDQAVLNPGDTLQFKLTINTVDLPELPSPDPPPDAVTSRPATAEGSSTEHIFLIVDIVAEPVIPVPEAAYGLLRWQSGEQALVECVRFAWNPAPVRIELVCPDDLRSELVRRRAIFQLADSVRPGALAGYAVQKITQTGSTHFPEPDLPDMSNM